MNSEAHTIVSLDSTSFAEKRHFRAMSTAESGVESSPLPTVSPDLPSPNTADQRCWVQRLKTIGSLSAWYFFGIVAIVTSKILVQEWRCPPLVLTVQQFVLGHTILRVVLSARSNVQPWPGAATQLNAIDDRGLMSEKIRRYFPWFGNPSFVLVGVFNAFDFLCSNFAFSMSAAHFVETIKASDPITTATIAVLGKVDRLNFSEAGSLVVLVVGVVLSTMGNASEENSSEIIDDGSENSKLIESVQTASLVLMANLCFGMRAVFQKRYRLSTSKQLNDVNLLFRMMQIGACFLFVPLCFLHPGVLHLALQQPSATQMSYLALAATNSLSYVIYNLASCFVLSKMSVLHHSSLNCLRRMVLIVATSLFFRKAFTNTAIAGLLTSLAGFAAFQFFRNSKTKQQGKDSNV